MWLIIDKVNEKKLQNKLNRSIMAKTANRPAYAANADDVMTDQ